jgi:ERF superfamily
MKVLKKLIAVRNELATMPLNKSGHNKFAGYKYFELGDFLPSVQMLFEKHGLCDVISFTNDLATMELYDTEDGSRVLFTSPMGSANLKGCHEVQNIGAVESYQRRYLYTVALAITENDVLDATTGSAPVEPKYVQKPVAEQLKENLNNLELQALAETMIAFGETCESVKELGGFWKKNQSKIDLMKEVLPDTYKELQSKFAEFKSNLKD